MSDTFQYRMYYKPASAGFTPDYRISPCPKFNIETRLKYANDNIIGYDYAITINGYATSVDIVNDTTGTGLHLVSAKIEDIRRIFGLNGGQLIVTDKQDNPLITATGGVVRSINFNQSENYWVNYTEYTIEIVFSEINYPSCSSYPGVETIGCGSGIPHVLTDYSSSLVNVDLYKIANFSDEWSFNLDDTIYNTYGEFKNEHFILEYKINATGQTYFNGDKVLPAWEMAKNFCQEKLYNFITVLIKGILNKSNDINDGCAPDREIDPLHLPTDKDNINGIINLDVNDQYGIFNEKITCDSSQTGGTFSLTYNSIVKKLNKDSNLASDNAIHTFTISKSTTNDNATKSTTMSIQGNIQGLLPGGIINSPNVIQLPSAGTIFIHNNPNNTTDTKYNHALDAYNKIINSTKDDLHDDFKILLGINNATFNVPCNPDELPACATHSVSHAYADGSITYATEFNNRMACIVGSDPTRSIRNVVVVQNDPTPRIAEFVVPGRSLGPIIQKIGSDEPRTISLRIEGVNSNLQCCFSPDVIIDEIVNSNIHRYIPNDLPSEEMQYLVLTKNSYNANPLDGSFAVQREYICADANALSQ